MKKQIWFSAFLSLLLATALVLSLAACGTGGQPDASGASAEVSTPQASGATSGEVVKLTATFPGSVEEFDGVLKVYNEALLDSGIEVEWMHIPPAQYWDKVNTMFSGDSAPDFTFMSEPLYTYASKGSLLPLDDYIAASETFDLDDWVPGAIEHFTYDGQIYGIPRDVNVWYLYFNKDLFEAAGEKTPLEYYNEDNWTWDTFREVAQRMTLKEGDRVSQYGMAFPNTSGWTFGGWLYSGGADIYNDDMTASALNSPEGKSVFQLFADMYMEDGSLPTKTSADNNTTGMTFETGMVAMCDNGSFNTVTYNALPFDYDVVPLPTNGSVDKNMTYVHNAGFSIAKSTPYPDECWRAIELITSLQAQLGLNALNGAQPPTFTGLEQKAEMEKPANMGIMEDMLKVGRPYPFSTTYAEEGNIMNKYVDQILAGSISVDDAVDKMAEEITAILNE